MAGEWIKIQIGLHEKPEVVRMASALNADEDTIAGKLMRLWGWANQQTTDGNVNMPATWIDRFVGLQGFSQAMSDVAWLVISEDGFTFPNFDRHNGSSAKRRALDSVRKQSVREMSASDADGMRTREEKTENREEEKVRKDLSPSSVAGSDRLGRPTGPNPKSVFFKIDEVVLQDNETLRRWFDWQLDPGKGRTPAFSPQEWEVCLVIAEHALTGNEPAKLFASLAGKKDHKDVLKNISEEIQQKAIARQAIVTEKPVISTVNGKVAVGFDAMSERKRELINERTKLFDCFTDIEQLRDTGSIHAFLKSQAEHSIPFVKWREMYPEGKAPKAEKCFTTRFIEALECAEFVLKSGGTLDNFRSRVTQIMIRGGSKEHHKAAYDRFVNFQKEQA